MGVSEVEYLPPALANQIKASRRLAFGIMAETRGRRIGRTCSLQDAKLVAGDQTEIPSTRLLELIGHIGPHSLYHKRVTLYNIHLDVDVQCRPPKEKQKIC